MEGGVSTGGLKIYGKNRQFKLGKTKQLKYTKGLYTR